MSKEEAELRCEPSSVLQQELAQRWGQGMEVEHTGFVL